MNKRFPEKRKIANTDYIKVLPEIKFNTVQVKWFFKLFRINFL